jgi:hypothetical protein
MLIGGKDFRLAVDPKAALKTRGLHDRRQPIARLDIPDKVTGRFAFMQDFKRKG